MEQNYVDCVADELFEEASNTLEGNETFWYDGIKTKIRTEFGNDICFYWNDFLNLRDTIADRSREYLMDEPKIVYNGTIEGISINVKQIRATNFIEDEDDERHLETLKMVDAIKEYIKEHPVEMAEPSVCKINGEYYDVLSKKQAEKMYHDYVTWLVTAGLV